MSYDVIGNIIGNLISWLMLLTFTLLLSGMCMAMIRNMLKMIKGQEDEEVSDTVKPKFKAKREPGRAAENIEPTVDFEPRLSTTAAALDAFDPAELEESHELGKPAFVAVTARRTAVLKEHSELSDLTDRLATEFDAQVIA